MDETLRLEYACTPAELKAAQELQVTVQVGAHSKWRAIAILLIVLGFLGLALFAKFLTVDRAFRPYVSALVVGCVGFLVALAYLRHKRQQRKPDDDLRCLVEVTPQDVRLAGPNGWAIVPWSGFNKAIESDSLFVLPDATGYQLLVIPKRVFPDEPSCDWFREQAQGAGPMLVPSPAERAPDKVDSTANAGGIRVEFTLRLSDYFDRALASWKIRGIMIFMNALLLGSFVAAMLNPPPNAVFSAVEVFFYFLLPFLIVFNFVIFLVIALATWIQHRRVLRLQMIELSDADISFSQSDGRASAPWNSSIRYKETPWSFLIWWQDSDLWFQLPKRAFMTQDSADHCRQILAKHALPSPWYLG